MFGLDDIVPGMTMNDFHTDLYVVAGDDFFQNYDGGSSVKIPVGISAVTSNIPENMKLKYAVYGWDELGEKIDQISGAIEVTAEPFAFKQLTPVEIQTPNQNMLMILATTLEDKNGKVLHRNFVPFKVSGEAKSDNIIITQEPAAFTGADWSIRQLVTQQGKKVWGMGSGYFEYEFTLPDGIDPDKLEDIEFRAELASRYPQEKYLEEGDAERIGMTVVSEKGTIPGYGKNSYPQTDEKVHSSLVTITANNQMIDQVELPDDPADHNGILSWMNQEPGWEWGSDDRSKPWLLDEAGSYGYLVKVNLDENSKKSAIETGKVTIRLHVDESTNNRGGLSIYGKDSGKYPMDLTLVITSLK
jgi:hypothetical protein